MGPGLRRDDSLRLLRHRAYISHDSGYRLLSLLMIKKILGTIVALALLYSVAWLGAAFWLQARLNGLAADLVEQGYAIERSEPRFVGFPAKVGILFHGLKVNAPPAQGAWRWDAESVRISLHAGAPAEPIVDLAGVHRITGLLAAPEESVVLNVGRGVLSLAFDETQSLENIVLKLADTTVSDGASDTPLLGLADSSLHVALKTPAHVTLWARDIALPEDVPVLGRTIGALDVTLDVAGTLPSGPLRDALGAWREGGGTVEVRSFSLQWPPMSAAGTGTIALDEALQPIGAATVKFQGFFALVEALTEKGHVQGADASMAKIILGMLARPSTSGLPELSLPITVQERKVYAGPVMLMEMPEVLWSAEAQVP